MQYTFYINLYLFKEVCNNLDENIDAHPWENTMVLTRLLNAIGEQTKAFTVKPVFKTT